MVPRCRGRGTFVSALVWGMLVLTAAWASAAQAQDITPARAQRLEGQIRAALAGMLGPRPVQVAAEGDHFAVVVPISGPVGTTSVVMQGPPVTTLLRPLGYGRWALDDVHLPSPLRLAVPEDKSGSAGEVTFTAQSQDLHVAFDPTGIGSSTLDGTIKDYSIDTRNGTGHGQFRVGLATVRDIWQSAGTGDGHFNAREIDKDVSDTATMPTGGTTVLTAERIVGEAAGAHLNETGPLLRALYGLALPSEHQKLTQTAITDMLDGFRCAVLVEHVTRRSPTGYSTLRSLRLGFAFLPPRAKPHLRLIVGFDGLEIPSLSIATRAYLPRHFFVEMELHGVSATQVAALANWIGSHGHAASSIAGQLESLLDQGPATLSIDQMSLTLGPATVKAAGVVKASSPRGIEGYALVAVTGLDALIRQADANPKPNRAGLVLLFLKALSTTDGTKNIWSVTYKSGKLVVNGHDLSAMMPKKS